MECTPAEVQKAFTNLGTCPAWQDSGSPVHVHLTVNGTTQQKTVEQSFSALAPLASRKVQLTVDAFRLNMAGEIVERLGTTLGPSLTHLKLSVYAIHPDFWPAVWRHLPGLQETTLWSDVTETVSSRDIAAFCSHATRPLRLRLENRLYSKIGPTQQLEQQCRTWGVPQVTVTEA
jgi:hypothetical protein